MRKLDCVPFLRPYFLQRGSRLPHDLITSGESVFKSCWLCLYLYRCRVTFGGFHLQRLSPQDQMHAAHRFLPRHQCVTILCPSCLLYSGLLVRHLWLRTPCPPPLCDRISLSTHPELGGWCRVLGSALASPMERIHEKRRSTPSRMNAYPRL